MVVTSWTTRMLLIAAAGGGERGGKGSKERGRAVLTARVGVVELQRQHIAPLLVAHA